MKMLKKRMLSLVLAVFLVVPLLPAAALAAEPTQADANFVKAVNDVVEREAEYTTPAEGAALTADQAWKNYLNERFYAAVDGVATAGSQVPTWAPKWNTTNSVAEKWKWGGATASAAAATGTGRPDSSAAIPYSAVSGTTTTYYIWSGEQLLYALTNCAANSVLELMDDIDLGGQNGSRWSGVNLGAKNVAINGNDHTIYNLCAIGTYGTAFASLISSVTGAFSMKNLTFDHANMCEENNIGDTSYAGAASIVGYAANTDVAFEGVTIRSSLFVGSRYVGGLAGRMFGTSNYTDDAVNYIRNCASESNVSFGNQHVGSLTCSCKYVNEISYCYSVDSTVISTGGHSGGLISCGGDIDLIKNCFVDAEVYGTMQTGVFTGAIGGSKNARPVHIISCYSSGFVEGQNNLGGFIGIATGCTNFYDCYSTALVGIRSSGTLLGGFVGNAYAQDSGGVNGGSPIIGYYNCYAAGEVGSTDTDFGSGDGKASNVAVDAKEALNKPSM